MKIRITVPWHDEVVVKTKPYGAYRVQFVSNLYNGEEAPATVSIVAIPRRDARGAAQESWDMSGYFQTQDEAIYAWENGFEVIPRYLTEAPVIEDAVVHAMIRAGIAAGVEE
jgi:hypothetical protein